MDSLRVKDVLGVAGIGKYAFQAGRVANGLGTTTRLTAALDILGGGTGLQEARGVAEALKASNSLAKGVVGTARFSEAAQVASVAGKVAPILTKGSAALGGVLGGVEIARGAHALSQGRDSEGTDRLVSGSADVVTATATYVAATSSASVAGLPVAAVALGVAGVAQGVKYGYKFRQEIGDAARAVGNKVTEAAETVRDGVVQGARWLEDRGYDVLGVLPQGPRRLGNQFD